MNISLTEAPLLIFLLRKPNAEVKGLDCVQGLVTAESQVYSVEAGCSGAVVGAALQCSPRSRCAPHCAMALLFIRAPHHSYLCPKKALNHHSYKIFQHSPPTPNEGAAPCTREHPHPDVPISGVMAAAPTVWFSRRMSYCRHASLQTSPPNVWFLMLVLLRAQATLHPRGWQPAAVSVQPLLCKQR